MIFLCTFLSCILKSSQESLFKIRGAILEEEEEKKWSCPCNRRYACQFVVVVVVYNDDVIVVVVVVECVINTVFFCSPFLGTEILGLRNLTIAFAKTPAGHFKYPGFERPS